MLEISDIETRGIVLSRQRNSKGADQTARMRRLICAFVVRIWQNRFSHDGAHMSVFRNNFTINYLLACG